MKYIVGILLCVLTIMLLILLYQTYSDRVDTSYVGSEDLYTVYIGAVTFSVTVADSEYERKKGLSGVLALPKQGGKLFIFDTAQKYGIWMKDMKMPIDVIWFDDHLTLIHTQKNISPTTYPLVFTPPQNARFVLEIGANMIDTLGLTEGDRLILPPLLLPEDIQKTLQ